MHDLPAGRFAAWATAWLSGRCSFDEALDALADGRAHPVTGLPGAAGAVPLGEALAALRGLGERRLHLVLPVPGDVAGLPRVPGLTEPALAAGQVAVGTTLALVPQALGSEVVSWTAVALPGGAPPPVEGTLRAASGALDLTVTDAARTLAGLDLARWHPEVPALLAGMGRAGQPPRLPGDTDPLALSVLARAQRLGRVLDLATAEAPGGAVSRSQAAARDAALRPLADAVRAALTAGYNWLPR